MASPKPNFAERWRSAVASLRRETERVQATADAIPLEAPLTDGHGCCPGILDPFGRHIHAFGSYTTALSCLHALLIEYDVKRSRQAHGPGKGELPPMAASPPAPPETRMPPMLFLTSTSTQRRARTAFVGSCAALAVALLAQAFLAGVAAMTDPGWWRLHLAWVNIFQWVVLVPPACAVLAGYPKWLIGASVLPVVLLYLQYVWAELGRSGIWGYGLGVHAASALALFGTTVALFGAALLAAPPRA